MSKEYIPLFLDFNQTTQDLTDEECGRLIRAIIDYANDEEYQQRLVGAEKIAFRFLQGVVDRNQTISNKRAEAGASKNKKQQTQANENKTQQNETNFLTKKEEQKTKPKNKNENKNKNEQNVLFDRFWKQYPRKESKPTALKAFEKLDVSEQLLATMLAAIERQKQSPQWQENGGQFIPYPATWLNQSRWEDEVQQPVQRAPARPVSAQQYQQRDYSGADNDAMQAFLQLNGMEASP